MRGWGGEKLRDEESGFGVMESLQTGEILETA